MEELMKLLRSPLAMVLVLILGSVGGSISSLISPPRPDPFTGTEGKELDRRLTKLEDRVDSYPPQWLIDRLYRVETKAESCESLLMEMRAQK
jgi:hypothetical protein